MNVAYTAWLMSCATCGATYIQSTASCERPNTESHEIASFLCNVCLGYFTNFNRHDQHLNELGNDTIEV